MSTTDLNKINELIALKEFEEAKNLLIGLLEIDEKNVEALKLLGLCNINLGLFVDGKKCFETVVKYKNDDATSWFYLASCYDHLDDFLHAKSAYNEVIKLRENYIDAYRNLGALYIKNQQPEKALELATKALALSEEDYLVHYLAGTALLAMKEFKDSIPHFEKAIELNPMHTQLYNNLGTAYLTIGQYERALETYKKASGLDPRNAITFYNIASILQIQNKNVEACEYFQKAFSLENAEQYLVALALCEFKSGFYDGAIQHYKMLVSLHPEKHNFQYNLACCYEMKGEYAFAIGILDQLTLLNPKSKLMSQKLADLYLKTAQPQRAKEIYERIIANGIVSPEIYYEYAITCVRTGDIDIAEKILKKVIELNPQAALARKDLGVIYLSKRLFDYAKDEFEKAFELAPDNNEIIFEYANFLHATSEFTKADEFYKKILNDNPNDLNVLIFSSLNSLALNKLEEALQYVEKALSILPEEAFFLFTAGKIHYALKDFEKAKMMLVKSWEMGPTVELENLLGLTYFELGEFEQANTIFLKLLDKNPMNTNLLLNSAKCYEKSNDKSSAKLQLNKALEIFPEFEDAQVLLKNLEK